MVVQCATYTTLWSDPGGGQAVIHNEGEKGTHIVGEGGLSHEGGRAERSGSQEGK